MLRFLRHFRGNPVRSKRSKMESADQQSRDWSNINPDLLEFILKKLPLPDVLRCRSVCRKWHSTTKALVLSPPSPPPLLMLRRKFLNLFGENDYLGGGLGHLFLNLAAPGSDAAAGSDSDIVSGFVPMGQKITDGWMVSMDRHERLYLSNPSSFGPVSRLRFPTIECPCENQCSKRPAAFIPEKVVFWGNPILGGECSSMAILCGCFGYPPKLCYAICEAGADFGNGVYLNILSNSHLIKDIICFNNLVYGVTSTGYVEAWDCRGGFMTRTTTTRIRTTTSTTSTATDATNLTAYNTTTTTTAVTTYGVPNQILSFQPKFDRECPLSSEMYLVESESELLLVTRNSPDMFEFDPRKKFAVYKLDFDLKRWAAVDSLGDRVLLLLCKSQAMSLSTTEFPMYERNSIYFLYYRTIYIFNMEDGYVKEAGSGKMITDEGIQDFWTGGTILERGRLLNAWTGMILPYM